VPILSASSRDRLRQLGQAHLGHWVEAGTGNELWTIQNDVLGALSVPRAQVVVPSCNASGKTFLAARAALAFYDAYTPGSPCVQCDPDGTKGGCRGCKVLTTSSKESHLKDNLWGEIRLALSQLARNGIELPGELAPADTYLLDSWGNHFIRGQVATKEESFQGYHAAHKLIIGDEATSVSEDVARGITSLQATADTRLLLIFNPTTTDTYAAAMARSPMSTVIKITAFDTPHFSGEHIPEGSNLVTPQFLETLKANGMGPGSYEWTTRVLAEFWSMGEDLLIPRGWVEAAKARQPLTVGTVAMGVDFAPYGPSEQTIAIRRGDNLVDITAYPAGRTDHFIMGDPTHVVTDLSPIQRKVRDYGPWVIVYDADGVGAGTIGDWTRLHEWAIKRNYMRPDSQIIPFRGGKKISENYLNGRSGWWWALRKRFERGSIMMSVIDNKLDDQLSQMTYSINAAGALRVETKEEMRRRGLNSPDRADAVMYAYAYSEELPNPNTAVSPQFVVTSGYATDRSERAMWERDLDPRKRTPKDINPVTGIPDDF
jgi:phage terminase large subunit